MKKLVLLFCVLLISICFFQNSYCTQPRYVSVDYKLKIVDQNKLHVTAELSNIKTDIIYVAFTENEAGVKDLFKRVANLKVTGSKNKQNVSIRSIEKGIYEIKTAGSSKIIITYDFDLSAAKHDYHLTTLTSSYLHIPGVDFFVRVFDKQDKIGELNNTVCKSFTVNIEDLPSDWNFVTTYQKKSKNIVFVDEYSVLITCGNYDTYDFNYGGCNYTIAFDKERKFDSEPIKSDFEKIIKEYANVFKSTPIKQQLVVMNQMKGDTPFVTSFGGQAKEQNILMEIGGINKMNQSSGEASMASFIAHELFHIWVPGEFQVAEEWTWFWEGFTDYEAIHLVKRLEIGNGNEFEDRLAEKYFNYENLGTIKDKVSLLDASTRIFDENKAYSTMVYDKGALVAYLYDKKLIQVGKNYESFMSDLYREIAIPQKLSKNEDIIRFMNKYIGEDTFTEKYVRGVGNLPIDPIKEFGVSYYLWKLKKPTPFVMVLEVLGILIMMGLVGLYIKRIRAKRV